MDFPSGAGVPRHIHGGSALVTVLSGEITLKEKGAEIVKKTGESWTEKPGSEHAVVNAGTATVRVAISMLLPKGAEATTVLK
jgi:quercetin dioxygenase-like cupin family protein